jgi:type I restriction enzyme S subunit
MEGPAPLTDWRFDVFGNVVEVNPRRKLVQGEQYSFIPMEALSTDSPNVTSIQRRVWGRSSGSKFQNGDVLLARITPSAENGKTALVNLPDARGFGSTELIVLSPKKGGIEDSRLLYYLVKFEKIRKQAIQRMTGSTGRQRIPPEALDDILCPVPPEPEQRRIASVLSTVDEVIQKTDEIIEQTQRLKKGLMQKVLTTGIGHTRFKKTEIGEIPEEWSVVTVGQVCDVRGGKRLTKGHALVEGATDHPYIRVVDFRDGTVDASALKFISDSTFKLISRYTISSDDVYLSIVGTIGLAGSVPIELSGASLTENAAKLCNLRDISKEFLSYLLNSKVVQRQIRSLLGKTSQPKLALFRIKKLLLTLPSLGEQKQIVSLLSAADQVLTQERGRKHQLEQLMKGLMQVLLTGRVRVKVKSKVN